MERRKGTKENETTQEHRGRVQGSTTVRPSLAAVHPSSAAVHPLPAAVVNTTAARGGFCPVTHSRSPNATFWCMFGPRAFRMLGYFAALLLSSLILYALKNIF